MNSDFNKIQLVNDETLKMFRVQPLVNGSTLMINCFTLITAPIGAGKTSLLFKAAMLHKEIRNMDIYYIYGHAGPDETFNANANKHKLPINYINGEYFLEFLAWFEKSRKEAFEASNAWNAFVDDKIYNSHVLNGIIGTGKRSIEIKKLVTNALRDSEFKPMPRKKTVNNYSVIIPPALNSETKKVTRTIPKYSFFIVDDMSQFPSLTKNIADKMLMPLAQNIRHYLGTMWFAGQSWGMLSYALKHTAIQVFGFGNGISQSYLNRSGTGISDQISTASKTGSEIVEMYEKLVRGYNGKGKPFLFVNVPLDKMELIEINL